MNSRLVACGVILALGISSGLLPAQCGGGGGSGGAHDHGGSSRSGDASQRDRIIQALLSEKESRQALMEAILSDPSFLREVLGRVLELPEWRALAAERLGFVPANADPAQAQSPALQPPTQTTAPDGRNATTTPAPRKTIYRCPMHPEVTSDQPGKCWKCGMTLERVS